MHSCVCANPACGISFEATFSRQRFCSDQCRNTVNNIAGQMRRRDRSARACGHCGAKFTPAYGEMRQVYCSADCRTKHFYKVKTGSTHRRRTKRFGGEFEDFDKRMVFERDGWKCRICCISTPPENQGKRVHNAPELDHVVPLSAGGDHTMANTQCLCRSCNAYKGASSMSEMLTKLAA